MKQFPLDFNESDFIIRGFSKLSKRKRISISEDRFTDSGTTEYSRENCETNKSSNSDGNLSDNYIGNINSDIRGSERIEEMKIYDPIRDTNQALKARTKQKVYTKYEKLRQRAYSDSS